MLTQDNTILSDTIALHYLTSFVLKTFIISLKIVVVTPHETPSTDNQVVSIDNVI